MPARVRNYDALQAGARHRRSSAGRARDLLAALTPRACRCGAVRTVAEALADPQLAARDMIATAPASHRRADLRVLGTPLKLSDTPGDVRTPPPTLGQHTDAILKDDLGFSETRTQVLRESGAI